MLQHDSRSSSCLSSSIITTAANAQVRVVHDRMPVILDGLDAEAAWLSADLDLDGALELVRLFPDGRLEVYSGVAARAWT